MQDIKDYQWLISKLLTPYYMNIIHATPELIMAHLWKDFNISSELYPVQDDGVIAITFVTGPARVLVKFVITGDNNRVSDIIVA